MDTTDATRTNLHDAAAKAGSEPAAQHALTALVLAPRWRLGRRSAAVRAVQQTLGELRPLARRLAVACHAAAAASFSDVGADSVAIVPDSESPLSSLACALDACADDPVLVAAAGCRLPPGVVPALVAALQDEGAGLAAAVDRRGLLEFPLLCRPTARPVIAACLYMGQTSIADLLRRPCARLVTLD